MIVISHRLASLVPADAILVLDRGKVHDIGKHEELLARNDIYSGLWYQQNRHVTPSQTPTSRVCGPTREAPAVSHEQSLTVIRQFQSETDAIREASGTHSGASRDFRARGPDCRGACHRGSCAS